MSVRLSVRPSVPVGLLFVDGLGKVEHQRVRINEGVPEPCTSANSRRAARREVECDTCVAAILQVTGTAHRNQHVLKPIVSKLQVVRRLFFAPVTRDLWYGIAPDLLDAL